MAQNIIRSPKKEVNWGSRQKRPKVVLPLPARVSPHIDGKSHRKWVWKTKLLLKLSIEIIEQIGSGMNCCCFQLNGISSSLCCAKVPEAPFASHCARCMQTPDAGWRRVAVDGTTFGRNSGWFFFVSETPTITKAIPLDWFKGKPTGNHCIFLWHMGLSCIFYHIFP